MKFYCGKVLNGAFPIFLNKTEGQHTAFFITYICYIYYKCFVTSNITWKLVILPFMKKITYALFYYRVFLRNIGNLEIFKGNNDQL
jgi:hypothetical protein